MTQLSLNSDPRRLLALVPFAYWWLTRLATPRDFAYFVATQILPTVWIVWRLSGQSIFASAQLVALGLLAFSAVYEVGYLVNDTWDAQRDPHGRRRTPFEITPLFLAAFTGIRAIAWLTVGVLTGWLFDLVWLVGFVCLAMAIVLHNALPSGAARAGTFFQLAVLRIVLPALGAIDPSNVVLMVALGIVLHVYLRFLSYLDGKQLLAMPERKTALFPLSQVAVFVPLAVLISVATSQMLFLEVTFYFVALYGANLLREIFTAGPR